MVGNFFIYLTFRPLLKERIKLDIDAPPWFKKLTGLTYITFIEEDFFDKRNRTLKMITENETFNSKASMIEDCVYFGKFFRNN